MFRTRGRKILRDVWARKGRTFLVSAAIFIGVAGTIALFSLSDIIIRQLREDIREDELAMLRLFVTVNADTELDNEAYLEMLDQRVPGLTTVMAASQITGYFKLQEDDEDFTEGFLNAFSEPYDENNPLSIEPLRLLEGEYPDAAEGEIAIEQRMAEEYDLSIGDQLYFRVLNPDAQGGQESQIGSVEPRTVSGIVFHPYTFTPDVSIYTSLTDANYLGGATGYNTFLARFDNFGVAEDEAETFAELLVDNTPYVPVFTQLEDPAQSTLITQAQTISQTMGFLALVSLIVSGFLVINVISSIVVEQKRQIGVMKSMGATRADNFVIYSGIAFAYGIIGVIPGIIVGIPAGNAAAHALAPQVNTALEGFQISPGSIILGVVVGLLVPVLSSLIPVFNGTRVKILDAMTDLGIDANYGTGPLARVISKLPLPITVRQGLSNVSLKKSRLAFTVITLAVAVGAFMGIYAIFNSITTGLDIFFDTFNVEIGLAPNEGRDPEEIVPLLRENFQEEENLLASIEPGFQLQVEFEGYDPPLSTGGPPGIFAYGYDIESETPAFNFTIDEGESLTPENAENGIVLSSALSNGMDKTIGDTVVMRVPGNTAEMQVVGISDFPLDQVWIDWRTLARISGYTVGAPRPNEYLTTVTVEGFEGDQGDNQVAAIGLDTQLAGFVTFEAGEFFTPGEPGVIISAEMAERGGISAGDTLTLTSSAEGGETVEVPVTGVFQIPPMLRTEDIPTDVIGMDWRALAELEGRSIEGEPLPQIYFLITSLEDPTADELDHVINQINEMLLNAGIPAGFLNFVELTDEISTIFATFQAILSAVAGLIALVGALGLLTTLSMSVFERQKEIGVMRSIGAGSLTVATQFLTEGLVVGVIAWLVGLPLALLIEVLLLEITGLGDTFPLTFPVTAAVVGLIGMLIITTIASLWPSLAAARKTVSDILRYQ